MEEDEWVRLGSLDEFREFNEAHRQFKEGILEGFRWSDGGLSVEVSLEDIWKGDTWDVVPKAQREPVKIRFGFVQNFELDNEIRNSIIEEPERAGWSFREIWKLKFDDKDYRLDRYNSRDYTHAEFLWHGYPRHIDLIFLHLEIHDPTGKWKPD